MHAEDFFIDQCTNWKAVEAVSECFPELDVISAFALVIETVDTID